MRTDSTRVSPVAVKEARQYIEGVFGKEYIGRDRKRKSAPGAQDAHEAIRPTDVRRLPSEIKKYLTEDQYKLYELIWNRFVASQMAAAVYDTVTCDIEANKHVFRATGSRLAFPGFTKLYEEGEDNPEEPAEEIIPLSVNERLELKQLDPQQHFTQPPQRYTEASLVKTLEQNGIGRPSTYARLLPP